MPGRSRFSKAVERHNLGGFRWRVGRLKIFHRRIAAIIVGLIFFAGLIIFGMPNCRPKPTDGSLKLVTAAKGTVMADGLPPKNRVMREFDHPRQPDRHIDAGSRW